MNKKETQAKIDAINDRIREVEAILQTCPEEEKESCVDELAELECSKDSIISDYWDNQSAYAERFTGGPDCIRCCHFIGFIVVVHSGFL